jgi:hypothetical protein
MGKQHCVSITLRAREICVYLYFLHLSVVCIYLAVLISTPYSGSPVQSASYNDLRELSADLDLPDVAM